MCDLLHKFGLNNEYWSVMGDTVVGPYENNRLRRESPKFVRNAG